jgi:hypothetical protein
MNQTEKMGGLVVWKTNSSHFLENGRANGYENL